MSFRRSDFTFDGATDTADLATLLALWGSDESFYNLDSNGLVGASDLAWLLAEWGASGRPVPGGVGSKGRGGIRTHE